MEAPSNRLLLRTIFSSALGSSRPPPPQTSPSNVVAKKGTQFHPFCSKFNYVWGGRGGVAIFSNLTGEVPTLLNSIVVTQKLKDRGMFNMMRFEIQDIVENDDDDDDFTFRINNQLFSYNEFRESFIPAFCVTVYKYQDGTTNTHYSIFNVNKLDKKQLHTALSRASNKYLIFITVVTFFILSEK